MVELKDDKAVYLEIPYDYLCIYQQLLTYLADFGEDALRDCDSTCKGANKGIIQCWNMFQAAIAAKALGRDKEASVLIKYIEAQLQLIYKGTNLDIYSAGELFPVDEDGFVFGVVTCRNNVEFYVHIDPDETVNGVEFKRGHLYVKVYNDASNARDFKYITDENKDLIVESEYIV